MEQEVGSVLGSFFGIVIVAIFGLIVGALAKWIMPGKDPGGIFSTMLLGIVGSYIGAGIGHLIGLRGNWGFLLAVLGALLVLLVYRQFRRAR